VTNTVIIAIDPGASGAIAIFADGQPAAVHDMPTMPRKASGQEVNGAALADLLRDVRRNNSGASFSAVVELVHARPAGLGGVRAAGNSSSFRFGEALGVVKGVLAALGIARTDVTPQAWKRRYGLSGADKDVSRTRAIELWPALADRLARKKDDGRAEALLIGAFWIARET
jgi:crossover junction endodeoxyribonuclease RuvC